MSGSGRDGLLLVVRWGWPAVLLAGGARWIHSKDAKYNGNFKAMQPSGWEKEGLQAPEGSKHYGISALLSSPCDPSNGIVLQYEVRFTKGITCGGAYIKLLTVPTAEAVEAGASLDPEALTNASPYSIMFGPDKCGPSGKVHLILRHRNPVDGTVTEHALTTAPEPMKDTSSHVYTLTLKPDNSFSILIDGNVTSSGSLLEDFSPAINPPATILDPSDVKPLTWSDFKTIADPSVVKPADWDDRPKVPDAKVPKPKGWQDDVQPTIDDPEAFKPAEWDDEEDGEWSAPQVANPLCTPGCGVFVPPMWANPDFKGAWAAPQIDNPDYKGEWVQLTIPNPGLFEDQAPLASIGLVGAAAIEIWTVDAGYVFDHILLAPATAEGLALAEALRVEAWQPRGAAEDAAEEAELAAMEATAAAETAAKAKATKAAQEARAAKAAESSSLFARAANFDAYLTTLILDLFDRPPLDALKQSAAPALALLVSHPQLSYAVAAAPLLMLMVLIMMMTGGRANPTPTARPSPPTSEEHDAAAPEVAEAKAEPQVEQEEEVEEQAEDEAAGEGEIRPQAAEVEEATAKPARRKSPRT
ncbi:MAG: hypothetical protein WDW36_006904 [Sanguina aurantia]